MRALAPLAAGLMLSAAAADVPPPADPLTVTVRTDDADRFAKLFAATGGKPTAAQIQRDYLDRGSYGVKVFTPGRIGDATRMAAAIAKTPNAYRVAIDRCLPVVKTVDTELRAIYLAMHGLFPTRALPQIYVVFGTGTSGGTAGPGAQVLGLETLCAISPDSAALRVTLRQFFAHETVHTFQRDYDFTGPTPLLDAVLIEGAADYVAGIVTGAEPNAARAAWAAPREAELWAQFEADLATTHNLDRNDRAQMAKAQIALERWVGNYGHPPAGWPYEAGYWIGMRIWQRYVAAQPDKHAALETVLRWTDAEAVLKAGRFTALPATHQMR